MRKASTGEKTGLSRENTEIVHEKDCIVICFERALALRVRLQQRRGFELKRKLIFQLLARPRGLRGQVLPRWERGEEPQRQGRLEAQRPFRHRAP